MTDAVEWATMKASQGIISGEINQHWLFCIPIQVGPATDHARNLRHWFALIIMLQVAEIVGQLVLNTALLTALWMAVTALIGLYAWYQDMNITYICLWGIVSVGLGVMAIISDLIPVITGVLTFDVFGLLVMISVPLVYFLAGAFAWHLYNDYREDHGKKAAQFDPFKQYAAKYDPKIPGADVDRALDEAAGRLFDSHSPGAFGAKGYSGFGSYGAASEPELFGRQRREGICC